MALVEENATKNYCEGIVVSHFMLMKSKSQWK